MKHLWIYIPLLFILLSSCSGGTHIKLDQANRTTPYYKKALSVIENISNVAYSVSDTSSLKILIHRIVEANCKNDNWQSVLNKLHYDINIVHRSTLSLDKMRKHCDSLKNFFDYDNENLKIIQANREVLSLMKEGIIHYDFKRNSFYTAPYHSIIDLFSYAEFRNGQKFADIGSGISNVGLIAGALFSDSQIYVNEIDTNLLTAAKNRLVDYKDVLNIDHFHFIIGDSMQIKIEEKMNLILMRKTLHHLKYPDQILQSCKQALKEDGSLLVNELIPSRKRKAQQCKKLMKKKEVLNLLKKNSFVLTKSKVNRNTMFLIYKYPF